MTITRITESHAEASDYEVVITGAGIARSTTIANTGAYSWRFSANHGYMVLPLGDATAARTSLYLYRSDVEGGDVALIKFKQSLSANVGVELRIMEDEETLRLYIDGVQQDEETWTNAEFVPDAWMRLSLVASSTQNFASVYLNSTKILTYSGAIANAPWDSCRYGEELNGSGFATYAYIDDIYLDSMTTETDALPPAYRFAPSYTEDNGDKLDWTALAGALQNANMVDDGAVDDGDTTYNFVTSSGANPEDTFETTDLVAGVDIPADHTITAAIPWCVCRKLNAADDAQIELSMYDKNTPAATVGSGQSVPITYGYRRDRFTTQPDSSSWNLTDFNAMQFGYEAGGSF